MSKKFPKQLVDPDFDLQAYRNDLVKQLLQELFKIVKNEEKTYGKDFADEVTMQLLASYVSTVVFNSLTSPAVLGEMNPQVRDQKTIEMFTEYKRAIEQAVASGFTGAFSSFNPMTSPDYQCDITCIDPGVIPDKVN